MGMFQDLNRRQIAILAILFCLSYAISHVWWSGNDNREAILANYPQWEFHGLILYDGYGNYAEHLFEAISNPGEESLGSLREFSRGYIHTLRPLFPLLVALVALAVRDILIAAILVNLAASLAAIYLLNLLIRRHLAFRGSAAFRLNLLFISHVSIVGMFARPMSDALALAGILLCFHLALCFLEEKRLSTLAWLALAILGTVSAKTVTVLLLGALPLGLIKTDGIPGRTLAFRFLLVSGGAFLAGVAILGLLKLFFPEHQAVVFLFEVLRGPLGMFRAGPEWWTLFIKAAILFLAISLQAYPFFWMGNREWLKPVYRILLAWIALYLLQRFVFAGFNLSYSRARYGIPLVPGAILLAYPGMIRLFGEKGTGYATIALAALNYALWPAILIKET